MLHTLNKISIQGLDFIDHASHDLINFLDNLFSRKQIMSHFLERNYHQPIAWLELALCIALMLLTFYLSRYLIKRHTRRSSKWPLLRHIAQRIFWPILLLVVSILTLYLWQKVGLNPFWLLLMVMAARWLIFIRLSLAIIQSVLPNNKMSDSLERTLSAVLWVSFLLWVSGIDDFIIHLLKTVKLTISSTTISLYSMLTALLWMAIILVIVRWVSQSINKKLMRNTRINPNLRIILSKIIPPVLMILAILIALPLFGINLTVLSVFWGAIGVGIGFGLQKVASNYISGFIILGDRSIRMGDRLTVGNITGYVSKITARFVVLRSSNGSEALIPNETFITEKVINESYSNKKLWKSLDVEVAYNTDLLVAMKILEEAAAAQERIIQDPPPKAYLLNFGDNGINLSVGFWVRDPENGFLGLFSAILLDIWCNFNHNGIEFPFPQREIRIVNDGAESDETAMLTDLKNQTPIKKEK